MLPIGQIIVFIHSSRKSGVLSTELAELLGITPKRLIRQLGVSY